MKKKRDTSLPQTITDEIRAGEVLAGDALEGEALERWYAQEKEAYYEDDADIGKHDPWYAYMRYVNDRLVFRRLADRESGSILFVGAGDGTEALAFSKSNPGWKLHFVESSDAFKRELSVRFPNAVVVDPDPDGNVPLEAALMDVVCAFCVLHHIANVSRVIGEVHRLLRPGGLFFVREPCSSMGDWRGPRSATPNERGISQSLMIRMADRAGFVFEGSPVPIVFEPINKALRRTIGFRALPFAALYAVDRVVSRVLALNDHYWRDTWIKKFGPSSYHYVFTKPGR